MADRLAAAWQRRQERTAEVRARQNAQLAQTRQEIHERATRQRRALNEAAQRASASVRRKISREQAPLSGRGSPPRNGEQELEEAAIPGLLGPGVATPRAGVGGEDEERGGAKDGAGEAGDSLTRSERQPLSARGLVRLQSPMSEMDAGILLRHQVLETTLERQVSEQDKEELFWESL